MSTTMTVGKSFFLQFYGTVSLKTSTLNMCTQSVQLKVGLINKMGVHAHYKTFAIFNSTCVLPTIWSEQSVCTV